MSNPVAIFPVKGMPSRALPIPLKGAMAKKPDRIQELEDRIRQLEAALDFLMREKRDQ